jgi:hypothetical protein
MRTQYILIDLENVQPHSLNLLDGEQYRLFIFVGANQAKLSFEIVDSVQRLGARAEYIKISGNGPNALDFHIAYYIGKLAAKEPEAYFHIVSKDTGFDPLIAHLRCQKILAERAVSIPDLACLKAELPGQRLERIVQRLEQFKTNKPRTVSTLSNTVAAIFQKQLNDGEVHTLLQGLTQTGYLSIEDNKIIYAGE